MKKARIVILCGGQGARVRDLAGELPKPLIPLGDKSILELSLEQYYAQGYRDYLFCVGYRGDLIERKFRSWRDAACEFHNAGEDAGMLRRLFEVRDRLRRDFIVVYGDTINKVGLDDLCRGHLDSGKLMTMVTSRLKIPFGLVEKVGALATRFQEKPEFDYYIGTLALSPRALALAGEDMVAAPDSRGILEFFHLLISLGEVNTHPFEGLQITFNTPLEHTTAQQQLTHYYTYLDT